MKIHKLKLLSEYAYLKLIGVKPFEIRFNDRNYEVGDIIKYTVLDNEELNEVFRCMIFKIVYITDFSQKLGYVVFSDKRLGE